MESQSRLDQISSNIPNRKSAQNPKLTVTNTQLMFYNLLMIAGGAGGVIFGKLMSEKVDVTFY